VAAGTTIGGIDIVLQGSPNLDFKAKADDTSTTLCAAKTYAAATTCTVDVTFTPLAPGGRDGAVVIVDGSGDPLATAYVYGTGVGPQITFFPSTEVFHPTDTIINQTSPETERTSSIVTVDASGNLYATGPGITEVFAAGGYTTSKVLNPAVSPQFIAVDGAGNLFVFNLGPDGFQNDGTLQEVVAAGGYTTVKTLLSDTLVEGMAVDASGNVFITNGRVKEIEAVGGYTTVKTLGSNDIDATSGITVDAAGNLFLYNLTDIVELHASDGYKTPTALPIGAASGGGSIAVDAADDIFTAEGPGGLPYIVENTSADGYNGPANVLFVYENIPTPPVSSMSIDGNGNVFMVFNYAVHPGVFEFVRSQSAALTFVPTKVDTTAAVTDSVSVQNSGNASLMASGLSFGDTENFGLTAGSGPVAACTGSFALLPGTECDLTVEFTPQSAGTLTGSLNITDNSGNATAATQPIALSGNGTAPGGPVAHLSATNLDYHSIAFGATATKTLTITNAGGGKLTINPSINGPSFKIVGSTCGSGITTGSCALQVEFDPVSLGSHEDSLTLATNGSTNPIVTLYGSGNGVRAEVSTSGGQQPNPLASINFGEVLLTSSNNTVTFAMIDIGIIGPVTVKTALDGPSYKVTTNDCLTPGITDEGRSACGITIEFSPVSLGTQYDTLTLTPSVGPPSKISLSGTATATLP
jgi:hypothetical protein